MSKITSVDYEAMPKYAERMKSYGKELNRTVSDIYEKIDRMRNVWYGQRYNALIKSFNNMRDSLDSMIRLVVDEIPVALLTVANNYSQADKGSIIASVTREEIIRIAEVTESKEVGMRFLSNEVSETKNAVSSNFKDAIEKMNLIETEYGKINWQSEASEAFKFKFKKLKTNIVSSFENVETQFSKLMEEALSDMQTTENANTVQ